MPHDVDPQWAPYLERYADGEWRAPIFRDMVLADARRLAGLCPGGLSFLDIGCGNGFDGDAGLQREIARAAARYTGVEPDPDIVLCAVFTSVHRCLFEDAPIDHESIDVAFAVMVVEHIPEPQRFWGAVHDVLRPGGVFWGFTVDARHWFVPASVLAAKLGVRDRYLDMLLGRRGEGRYENYQVFYRSNTPDEIARMTQAFSHRTFLNYHRVGQMDPYIPRGLRWISRLADRRAIQRGRPGAIMAVRLVK